MSPRTEGNQQDSKNYTRESTNEISIFDSALAKFRKRLIDTTKKNPLIDARPRPNKTLRIVGTHPNVLTPSLIGENSKNGLRFKSVPEPSEEKLIEFGYIDRVGNNLINYPTAEEWAQDLKIPIENKIPNFSNHITITNAPIQTIHYPSELDVILENLRRENRSSVAESGDNKLHLAIGFLEWFESSDSSKKLKAPLYLIPVSINVFRNNKTYKKDYQLVADNDEPLANIALVKRLNQDIGIELPEGVDASNPEDYLKSVDKILNENAKVSDIFRKWRVNWDIAVYLASFKKILMWKDLDSQLWLKKSHTDNKSLSEIVTGCGDIVPISSRSGEIQIDEVKDIHNKFPLLISADSTQHNALIEAMNGKNIVIEGPPGTGKSQTIANLIAMAMLQGKNVLFVAEKMAALKVVYKKLKDVDLAPFCLELHSERSNKQSILSELESRINMNGRFIPPKKIQNIIEEIERTIYELNRYSSLINSEWKNSDMTIHEILTGASRHRKEIGLDHESVSELAKDLNKDDINDPKAQIKCNRLLKDFHQLCLDISSRVGEGKFLHEHPWFGLSGTKEWREVKRSLENWQGALNTLFDQCHKIEKLLSCKPDILLSTLDEVGELIKYIDKIIHHKSAILYESLGELHGGRIEEGEKYIERYDNIRRKYSELKKVINIKDLAQLMQQSPELRLAVDCLRKISNHNQSMDFLDDKLITLDNTINNLRDIQVLMQDTLNGMDESDSKQLRVCQDGIKEFRNIAILISKLEPNGWHLRDKIYENNSIDDPLRQLERELNELSRLQNEIRRVYSLDHKMEIEDLLKYQKQIEEFKWNSFSAYKEYRLMKKQIMRHKANKKVSWKELKNKIDDLIRYLKERNNLDNDQYYTKIFGKYFKGSNTDVDLLCSLREWYIAVRERYPRSIARKINWGNEILSYKDTFQARQIHRLVSEEKLIKKIDDTLRGLEECKKNFSGLLGELNNSTLLVENEECGLLSDVFNLLIKSYRGCELIAKQNDAMLVSDVINHAEKICKLSEKYDKWDNCGFEKFNQLVFGKRIKLNPVETEENQDNAREDDRWILENTLELAKLISEIPCKAFRNAVYSRSSQKLFNDLSAQVSNLRKAYENEENRRKKTIGQIQLDYEAWRLSAWEQYKHNCEPNRNTRKISDKSFSGGQTIGIKHLILKNKTALDNNNALSDWQNYSQNRKELKELGLEPIISLIEQKKIKLDQLEQSYKAIKYHTLSQEILNKHSELRSFSTSSHESTRRYFQKLDESLHKLQAKRISAELATREPELGNNTPRVKDKTELALINHEIGKKKKHIPIRQLLLRAPKSILALTPCFMMSPLSIARYLGSKAIRFDLVIMDEASQIFPEDALGAIARCKQLVVVGDPKQLPPTAYFTKSREDRDDDDEQRTGSEDSESILDIAQSIYPTRRLEWHYRSEHESLIQYSNRWFYDKKLLVFPSPHHDSDDYGVKYEFVEGAYIDKTNLPEAMKVAELVREHYTRDRIESLGVIAVNSSQQVKIEECIENLKLNDEIFSKRLESSSEEKVYVKNLESIQGNEFDVVIISLTYGPEQKGGRVAQRFGPINWENGWRRLNVLMTRARKRMHIFSSMHSYDIDVDEGGGAMNGKLALRKLLEFCETGKTIDWQINTDREPDSDFEIDVKRALENEGFECVAQFGVGNYFIDVVVRDPKNRGRFLMGIECDGATYHSAKSARDRDRIRQNHLKNLGWTIKRIWSTDWFKNPRLALNPILNELNGKKSK